ncbi:MAG: hypothetical protein ACK55I_47765, partial [bacterium]
GTLQLRQALAHLPQTLAALQHPHNGHPHGSLQSASPSLSTLHLRPQFAVPPCSLIAPRLSRRT